MRFEADVKVTPALARKFLSRNRENNRRPKTAKVASYARDIAAGRWLLTGEALKFDTDGYLMDGQNRLMAVIEARKSAHFSVMWDLDPKTMLVMDTGASRTFGDVLAVAYGTRDKYNVSSVVRWILAIEAGVWRGHGGGFNPTHAELVERYDRAPDTFDTAGTRGRDVALEGLGVASAAGTAYYLFADIHGEEVKGFFDSLISGANVPDGSPILALRRRLTRASKAGGRLHRAEQLALFVRAWNAFRRDEPRSSLIVTPDAKLTNDNFPRPL
jgi:hypothetical protein